jgi:two-component system LytT family response regulator
MNKIRVLVVDDEPLARRGLRQLLETESDFTVVGEASNGREAFDLLEKLVPELVFLDIQMPLVDGFSFVENLDREARAPEIVFVTAYDEHAIRAFEAGAIDYVLKPVNEERFRKTLERVRRRRTAGEDQALGNKIGDLLKTLNSPKEKFLTRISVKENGRIRLLAVEKIDWISSLGNYIEIHAGREKFVLRETMDGIAQKLDPSEFVRIRRSTIVQIGRIKELQPLFNGEYAVVLTDGIELSSSRRYRKNLEALLNF